jgi:hypothetical protein
MHNIYSCGGGDGGNRAWPRPQGESDDDNRPPPISMISATIAACLGCLTLCEPVHASKTLTKQKKTLLPEEAIQGLFKALDIDGSGVITLDELIAAVKSGGMGLLHSEAGVNSFMRAVDSSGRLTRPRQIETSSSIRF